MRCRPLSFQSIGLDSDRQYMIRMSFGSHSSRTNAQPVTTNNSADVCYIDSTCFTIVNKSDCVTWRDNSFVTSTLHSDTCDVEVKIELLVKAEAGSCGQPDQHVQTNVDIFDTLSSRVLTIASIDRDLHDVCIVTFAHESALGNLDVEIQVESHTSRSSSQIQNYDGSTGPSTVRHWPLQIPCAKVVTLPASSITNNLLTAEMCTLMHQKVASLFRGSWNKFHNHPTAARLDDSDLLPRYPMPSRYQITDGMLEHSSTKRLTSLSAHRRPILLECNFVPTKQTPSGTKHQNEASSRPMEVHADKPGFGHVIVLVTGYDSCAQDLKSLETRFSQMLPHAHFLRFSARDSGTKDLHYSGVRLARLVGQFIGSTSSPMRCDRLSFVAHGAGGLCVRCALPWIQEHASKLDVLVTLATPHLGLFPSSLSFYHRCVFYALRTLKPNVWLEQLAFADGRYANDALVYSLSHDDSIGNFRTVLLASLHQDWSQPLHTTSAGFCQNTTCSDKQSRGFQGWLLSAVICVLVAYLCWHSDWVLGSSHWRRFPRSSKFWVRIFRASCLGLILIGYRIWNMRRSNSLFALNGWCTVQDQAQSKLRERLARSRVVCISVEFSGWQFVYGVSGWVLPSKRLLTDIDFLNGFIGAYGSVFQ